MTAGGELDSAGADFARTAARALQTAQALVEMHARSGERRAMAAERAAREQERARDRAAREDELAERRVERAQRMAERDQRMAERGQRISEREQRTSDRAARDGTRQERGLDSGVAREAMAARWAAAEAVRRLHPDAAAAWDAAMREAGIDADGVRRLADAATTARTATPGTDHLDTATPDPPPDPAADTEGGRAEQLAIEFTTAALDQDRAPASEHHPGPGHAALAEAGEGGGIGEAITAAAHGTRADAVDTTADPAVFDDPGVDAGAGPIPAVGADAEPGR